MKTCCVTGHRELPGINWELVRARLCQAVRSAVDEGCVRFISGFAAGADLMFAQIVLEEKKNSRILQLEAAIPYPGRMKTPDPLFQKLIRGCDTVKIHSPAYAKNCFMIRNRYMVEQSELVIAVYDGRKTGGTAATVRYALELGRRVENALG